jgi:hypothetical protein
MLQLVAVVVLDLMVVAVVVLVPGEKELLQLDHTQFLQLFRLVQVELDH